MSAIANEQCQLFLGQKKRCLKEIEHFSYHIGFCFCYSLYRIHQNKSEQKSAK